MASVDAEILQEPPRSWPPGRFRRALLRAAEGLGVLVLFVTTAAGALVLHLGAPPARRLVGRAVNAALDGAFQGKLLIDRVDHVTLWRGEVSGARARVLDPSGEQVLLADGVSAKLDLGALFASLVRPGPVLLRLREGRVNLVDVHLAEDPDGELTIQRAFEPRVPSAPEDPLDKSAGVAVRVEGFTVVHGWAHGGLAAYPVIDADLEDARGDFVSDQDGVHISLSSFGVTARALPLDVREGRAQFEGKLDVPDTGPLRASLRTAALRLGEAEVDLRAELVGDRLDAAVDVPRTRPEALRAVVQALPVYAPVEAHVEAHGPFSALAVQARIGVGDGRAQVDGVVRLGEQVQAEAQVRAEGIEPRAFAPEAPEGRVNASARATVWAGGLEPSGTFAVSVEPTTVAGQPTPAVETEGKFQGDVVSGTLRAEEPGLKARVSYALGSARAAGRPLDLEVEAQSDELGKSPRLAGQLGGRAQVEARARLVLAERPTVEGEATVRASGLRAPSTRVASATVRATARGALSAPALSVRVQAGGVSAGGVQARRVVASAAGTLSSSRVSVEAEGAPGERLSARADVGLTAGVTVRGAQATVERGGERVEVSAGLVRAQGALVQVDRLSVRGDVGKADVDVRKRGPELTVKGRAEGLDLPRLARLAGAPQPDLAGRLDAEVDVTLRGQDARGTVAVRAKQVSAGDVRGIDAEVKGSLDQRSVQVEGQARWQDGAQAKIELRQGKLAGPALRPESWKRATFDATTTVDADLEKALALLPEGRRPVDSASGRVHVEVAAQRSDGDKAPALRVAASTKALDVALRPAAGEPSVRPAPTTHGSSVVIGGTEAPVKQRIRGVDLDAKAELADDGKRLALTAAMIDKSGPLASVELTAEPPIAELLRAPSEATRRLLDTRFEARVRAHRRKISDWPEMMRPRGLTGEIELVALARGTAREPELQLGVDGAQVEMPSSPLTRDPVDLRVRATYSRAQVRLGVDVEQKNARLATVRGAGSFHHEDLIEPRAEGPRWDGDVQAEFTGLPLQSIGALANTPLVGCLYGSVRVAGLHRDLRMASDLRIERLQVGEVPVDEARLMASFDGKAFALAARLREAQGSFEVGARSGMTWGDKLAPSLEGGEPLAITLRASGFRLKPLEPLLQAYVSRLDGLLDADVRIDPNQKNLSQSNVQGWLQLREGVVDPVALGQELHHVEARVEVGADGTVRLQKGSLRGLTGRVVVNAEARFDKLRLIDARGSIDISERDRFVITNQGIPVGDAWGHVDLKAALTPDKKSVLVEADVKRFELELPKTKSRSIQATDPEPTVRLGYREDDGTFHRIDLTEEQLREGRRPRSRRPRDEQAGGQPRSDDGRRSTQGEPPRIAGERAQILGAPGQDPDPEQEAEARRRAREERRRQREKERREQASKPSPILLDLTLPRSTHLHSNQIDLYVAGKLRVGLGGARTTVAGQAQVDHGHVDIQGRRFFVERATATFEPTEEPSNPTVSATARFEAADATRIYADYLGTVEDGRLNLRSDPALSQGEILSLILFGTREGLASQGRGQSATSTGERAASLGGGVLTQGLNEALSDLSLGQVTTRIDTTSSSSPRPEIAVSLSQDVTATLSYRIGVVTPGQNPDTSTIRLEYRFRPRWSLETSLGDRGTSILDLYWRYRY